MTIAGYILRAGGMAKYVEPDYSSMPTPYLQQINQDRMRFGMGDKPAAKTQAELTKRYRAETIAHHWRRLEHEGFGL